MTNQYESLKKTKFTQEQIRDYTRLLQEIDELESRLSYLQDIAHENEEIEDYVWKTKSGEYIAITNMEDDHLVNTINLLARNGRTNRKLIDEAVVRKLKYNSVLENADDTKFIRARSTIIDPEF